MRSPWRSAGWRRGCGPVAAVIFGLTLVGATAAPPQTPAPADSAGAEGFRPDLRLADVSSLDSLRVAHRGRWLLVNVWATWCRPCVAETPDLVRLAADLGPKPFALVGISTDDLLEPTFASTRKKVGAFAETHRVGYPQLLYRGSNDSLLTRFRLSGVLPTTLLLDPEGAEVGRWEGKLSAATLRSIRNRVR